MSENKKAIDELRELFANFLDLEQEVYNTYEKLLDDEGLTLIFGFKPDARIDFYKFVSNYSLWQIFAGSCWFMDEERNDLRKNLLKPWFLSKDFINMEISIGQFSAIINNNNSNNVANFYSMKELLQITHLHSGENLFNDNSKNLKWDLVAVAKELKNSKKIKIKLTRSKKDASGFRKSLEQESSILDTDGYRVKLEYKFQHRIQELLGEEALLYEVLRLHLQERLALWGYRFSGLLSPQELLDQYKHIKLTSLFANIMEARLFIDYIPYNSNEDVLNQIQGDEYKKLIHHILSSLEENKSLYLEFSSLSLNNNPEFIFKI